LQKQIIEKCVFNDPASLIRYSGERDGRVEGNNNVASSPRGKEGDFLSYVGSLSPFSAANSTLNSAAQNKQILSAIVASVDEVHSVIETTTSSAEGYYRESRALKSLVEEVEVALAEDVNNNHIHELMKLIRQFNEDNSSRQVQVAPLQPPRDHIDGDEESRLSTRRRKSETASFGVDIVLEQYI
jgi:hypothetical protein